MYNIVRHTLSFDVMNKDDRLNYEEVLNDPLCSITKNETQVVKDTEYDRDTGKPIRQVETIIRTIEWDEKVLL